MCLNITNIILIIVSYSCIIQLVTPYSNENIDFGWQEIEALKLIKEAPKDCEVRIPLLDNMGYMPVPFGVNFTEVDKNLNHTFGGLKPSFSYPKMIRPDGNGFMIFKHNTTYKMACTNSIFVSPVHDHGEPETYYSEITVKCFDGFFEYDGYDEYKFKKFKCAKIPQAKLISTESMCQGKKSNKILKVGFQSINHFVNVYRICFDTKRKTPLYAWHFVDSPIYKFTQITMIKPKFVSSEEYDSIDIEDAYFDLQNYTVKKYVKEKFGREIYYEHKEDDIFFVVPGHLISELEFSYASERHASYLYENSAPQWYIFNRDVWSEINKAFRRYLVLSNSKHLVVTGVLSSRSMNYSVHSPSKKQLYLTLNNTMPIPDYFWKMDYNYGKEEAAVYVAANFPITNIDRKVTICKTMRCPGRSLSYLDKKSQLFFCCTKKSFEQLYGTIDPVVYEEFNI